MNRRRPTARSRNRPGEVDLSRRMSIVALGTAGAALASGRSLAQAARCVLTENAGEGPFYFDPELIRSDIRDGSPGAPLAIALQVTRASDCSALSAARVDLWQANAVGLYSGYAQQPGVGGVAAESAIGQSYLRGTQLTGDDGWARFTTVYPSWYGGRTPHLHFKVWLGPDEVVASQVFFPDEVSAFVFETFDPYREHIAKRTTFNDNDPLQQGIYCDVAQHNESGVDASAVIAVET